MNDLEKPRETYRRLSAIAESATATDSERTTAREVMARYIAKYGSEVGIPESEPTIERDVTYSSEHERMLSVHCALFTGAVTFKIGKRLAIGTKRERFKDDGKTTRIEGPESAVLSAVSLYEHHRVMMNRLLQLTENGYRFGAMPLPCAVHREQAEPMAPELMRALRAAADAGSANAASKRLAGAK